MRQWLSTIYFTMSLLYLSFETFEESWISFTQGCFESSLARLKLALWMWRSYFLKVFHVFSCNNVALPYFTFWYIDRLPYLNRKRLRYRRYMYVSLSQLWRSRSFVWRRMNLPYPMVLRWFWRSKQKCEKFRQRRTTDKFWSVKFTWWARNGNG